MQLGADEMLPILVMALIWSPLINPMQDIQMMSQVVDDQADAEVCANTKLVHSVACIQGGYMFYCFGSAVEFIIHELDPSML